RAALGDGGTGAWSELLALKTGRKVRPAAQRAADSDLRPVRRVPVLPGRQTQRAGDVAMTAAEPRQMNRFARRACPDPPQLLDQQRVLPEDERPVDDPRPGRRECRCLPRLRQITDRHLIAQPLKVRPDTVLLMLI